MDQSISKTNYILMSVASEKTFQDTGWLLTAPNETQIGLVRAIYEKKQLKVKDDSYGIYKFSDWLPIHKMMQGSYAPTTFKS